MNNIMINIDESCAKKLIGLFKELDLIIPNEMKDIVNQLVNQLEEQCCDEVQISLVLNFFKKLRKRKENDELLQNKILNSRYYEFETKEKLLITLLSNLLLCQHQNISNKIGR